MVRVIVSCSPGTVSSILQRRGCQTLNLEPLPEAGLFMFV